MGVKHNVNNRVSDDQTILNNHGEKDEEKRRKDIARSSLELHSINVKMYVRMETRNALLQIGSTVIISRPVHIGDERSCG